MNTKLREIREAQGLSQRLLAEKSHTNQGLLSALELGKMKPWRKVAKRLSRALKIPIEQLFPDEEIKQVER